MRWRELTEAEHVGMLEAGRRKHPRSVAVLAFDDFFKRPVLIQLPLFPELVRPTCWTPRTLEQHGQRGR